MLTLNRKLLLDTLVQHETLTFNDIGKRENLGLTADSHHLQLLLDELEQESFVQKLDGASQSTYTITDKGIAENERLKTA